MPESVPTAHKLQISVPPPVDSSWLSCFDPMQRHYFRINGKILLGLLLQYNSRDDSGEPFLKEGMRLAREYGAVCSQTGMDLGETARAFLFYRQSILEMLFDTSLLSGSEDQAARRLFQSTGRFMDALLIATLEGYTAQNQ